MTPLLTQAIEQVQLLPPETQDAIAGRLLEELNAQLHPDWPAEFDRRVAEYDAGRMAALSWADVQAAADGRLKEQEPARG